MEPKFIEPLMSGTVTSNGVVDSCTEVLPHTYLYFMKGGRSYSLTEFKVLEVPKEFTKAFDYWESLSLQDQVDQAQKEGLLRTQVIISPTNMVNLWYTYVVLPWWSENKAYIPFFNKFTAEQVMNTYIEITETETRVKEDGMTEDMVEVILKKNIHGTYVGVRGATEEAFESMWSCFWSIMDTRVKNGIVNAFNEQKIK